ncbi:DinB family protein, partial [Marinobacter sp. UBA2498]|uniref:DinB family protein n=1 Tax=Marinobacter sp. UBA2498 TaxID=1946813 RepID=UPI00257F39B7
KSVTIKRNERSRSTGTGGHVQTEWAVTMGRNMHGLTQSDLDFVLSYHNTKGIPANKRYSSLVLHFFNHQAHHRGQVSALLSQAGADVGVTDLLALIPKETHV